MKKLGQKLPPLKKSKLSKKSQKKEEDEIKRRLTEDNQYWSYWKFQIHWNKLEWVNSRSRDERKINFVCLFINRFKYNNKPARWVVHSQLRSLDTYDFLRKTPGVDE